MENKEFNYKVKRKSYNNIELVPLFKQVDNEIIIRKKKRSCPFKQVLTRYPIMNLSSFKRHYYDWIKDRTESFIVKDKRKLNSKNKALSYDNEEKIKKKILELYDKDSLVSYSIVSNLALEEWKISNQNLDKNFTASDAWVTNFLKRNQLSSQAISLRSSAQIHRKMEDNLEEVIDYKKTILDFSETNGNEFIFNYDETSFKCLTGKIRTIAPKNCKNQPRIKTGLNKKGPSIGLTISARGKKLKPILVTHGLTKLSLKKFGKYKNDPECILTMNKSGWFTSIENLKVLNLIYDYTKGLQSLLIWDNYKAHLTDDIINKAKEYNIKLLNVPKGMTPYLLRSNVALPRNHLIIV